MSTLADVFAAVRLQLDGTGFEAQATALADKSGKNVGDRMSQQLSSKLKSAIGAGIGAGVGISLAGANQLDAATRQLQADAGLTADEANRAQKAMAGIYANNLEGFDAIGRAMGKVRTDMGLSGDEADKTAEKFIRFSTATGQDAAEAVAHLDDILDLFHLKASDAGTVLDKLVRSHQLYGTNVQSSEEALVQFGPALEAANLNIDDGIALLNLFEKAGVAPEKIATAFAKALKSVKSPEELQKLIADIGATKDPFERAQKAIALFGNRAGPQLAAALARSGGDLNSFKISMQEAAGATDRGAAAVESGFGAQFTLLLHRAGGALAEFGTQFGPLVMLASVAGPKAVGLITTGLGALLGSLVKAGPVVKAATLAGTAIGGLYETAWLRAAYALDAIKGVISSIGSSSAIQGAATKAGALLGGRMGIALKAGLVAAAALAWVEVINTYNDQKAKIDAQGKDIGKSVGEQIATGTTEQLLQSKAALESGIKQLGSVWDLGIFSDDARRNLQTQLDAVNAKLLQGTGDIKDAWRANLAGLPSAAEGAVHPLGRSAEKMAAAFSGPLHKAAVTARGDIDVSISLIIQDIIDARKALSEAATGAAEAIYGPLIAKANLAQTERDLAEQKVIASAKSSTRQQVTDAQARINELNQTRLEQLAILAGYGDQAAASTLRNQISILESTKNLSAEQRAELEKLRTELYLVDAAARTLAQHLDRFGNRIVRNVPQAKAAGGPVQAGQPYLVGEYRPELFVPDSNGTIIPNPTVGGSTAASMTQTVGPIYVSGIGSDVSVPAARRFGQEILDTVAEGLREQRARFVGSIA